jgi:flagellar basal body-associated protein FliL
MIQQTDSAVLSAQDGQERIRTELQKLLNTILGGEYILNVGFLRLMVL